MALGRLFHYGFDLLAVSTVIAGVKKSTGYAYVVSMASGLDNPTHKIPAQICLSVFTLRDEIITARKPSRSSPKVFAP
jgi:hypothetical protein